MLHKQTYSELQAAFRRISGGVRNGIEASRVFRRRFDKPEIFNTDQGSQFTSMAFTGVLLREKIDISMDGRGA